MVKPFLSSIQQQKKKYVMYKHKTRRNLNSLKDLDKKKINIKKYVIKTIIIEIENIEDFRMG